MSFNKIIFVPFNGKLYRLHQMDAEFNAWGSVLGGKYAPKKLPKGQWGHLSNATIATMDPNINPYVQSLLFSLSKAKVNPKSSTAASIRSHFDLEGIPLNEHSANVLLSIYKTLHNEKSLPDAPHSNTIASNDNKYTAVNAPSSKWLNLRNKKNLWLAIVVLLFVLAILAIFYLAASLVPIW